MPGVTDQNTVGSMLFWMCFWFCFSLVSFGFCLFVCFHFLLFIFFFMGARTRRGCSWVGRGVRMIWGSWEKEKTMNKIHCIKINEKKWSFANTVKRGKKYLVVTWAHVCACTYTHPNTNESTHAYMTKEFRNLLYLQRIQSLEQNSDFELDVCTNSLARLDTVEKDTCFCFSRLLGKRKRDSTGGHRLRQNGPGKGHSRPDTCLLRILICRTQGKNMGFLLGHYSARQDSSREC